MLAEQRVLAAGDSLTLSERPRLALQMHDLRH